jgi:4-carboxymuconolactone decarboxylase
MPKQPTSVSKQPTFGRYAEIPLEEMTPALKAGYELVVKELGQARGPYKIFIQNPEPMQVVVPVGAYLVNDGSSLSQAERELATNVINGKWLAAYPNYGHEIVAKAAGLPADKVDALIAGLPTSFHDPRQQVIYELTLALSAPRVIPQGLYDRAVGLLGDRGVTDLTMLLGYFCTTCFTLNAYNVPAGAVGLKR